MIDSGRSCGRGIWACSINADYAAAAAVAIRSVVEHTTGRVTFYILSPEIPDDVKGKLRQAVPDGADATVVFLDLPSDDCAAPHGLTWAKIAMIPILPVERALYLDADVLVRGDLKPLWDIDLEGKSIAAAVDVGFPMGHDGVGRGPYFNAGVLLLDLATIRKRLAVLNAVATRMSDSKMQDQDALNAHFVGDWLPLSLAWNAQGLGTYAKHHTPERAALKMGEMEDPKIVHFTGALHPSMAEVISPFVQPYGGKPWGYAGAPGHPFAQEWWEVCEQTPWRGWRSSTEYRELCKAKAKDAIQAGLDAFNKKLADV